MKKDIVRISVDAEKLRAVKQYMEKKESKLEDELTEQVQKLYEKYVPANERLSVLLLEQTVNLDQLNFLLKRLDSFDQKELSTFYAAAYAEKAKTMTELINLSFNHPLLRLGSRFQRFKCRRQADVPNGTNGSQCRGFAEL